MSFIYSPLGVPEGSRNSEGGGRVSECGKMESSLEMRFEIAGLPSFSVPPSSICSHHLTLKALKSFTRDMATEEEKIGCVTSGTGRVATLENSEIYIFWILGRVHETSDTNAFLKGRRSDVG